MDSIKLYITANKEWLFPVIAAIAGAVFWLFKQLTNKKPQIADANYLSNDVNITNSITVPLHNTEFIETPIHSENEHSEGNAANAKERVTILFIDDDTSFKIVSMLKKAGWKRVSIVADIDRIDHDKVKAADIVFVDVQGVGKKLGFDREGLGLMKAIKTKFPDKKTVIYSAVPLHDIFADEIDHADGRLRKTAEFIQFEQKIEELAR